MLIISSLLFNVFILGNFFQLIIFFGMPKYCNISFFAEIVSFLCHAGSFMICI